MKVSAATKGRRPKRPDAANDRVTNKGAYAPLFFYSPPSFSASKDRLPGFSILALGIPIHFGFSTKNKGDARQVNASTET